MVNIIFTISSGEKHICLIESSCQVLFHPTTYIHQNVDLIPISIKASIPNREEKLHYL